MKHPHPAATLLLILALGVYVQAGNGISGYESSYALCTVNGASANTPATDTPEVVASTWTVGASSSEWAVTTGGRFTYSGTETRAFQFMYAGGVNSGAQAVGDRCSLTVAKGGSSIAASIADWDGLAAGFHAPVSVSWVDGAVATGDYFEIYVSIDNDTNAPAITVDHGTWSVWGGR